MVATHAVEQGSQRKPPSSRAKGHELGKPANHPPAQGALVLVLGPSPEAQQAMLGQM
ncbi:MAG: hypothetical protein L6R36_008563 [Xanthoria steineri]|nr:MAG: hypothetical protein L6R36_008563 [Xanthoria steineri]